MPIHDLAHDLLTLTPGGWSSFWVLFYAFATYGNAGFLRDQMCRQICPYARFQFVMFDPDTLIIAYDAERGESRGARAKGSDPRAQGLGDCVDCGICVQVCPTGIDIRNGLQNECIGCAACIDACDQVMDKMSYPRGLIRYSTENAVSLRYTPLDIVRRATYRLQIMNTGDQTRKFRISIAGPDGIRLYGNDEITVAGGEIGTETAIVRGDPGAAKPGSIAISFNIADMADPQVAVLERSKFWMPE